MPGSQPPTVGQVVIGDVAPKLVSLTDDVLFGDVRERAARSKRDRSPTTVEALIAAGTTESAIVVAKQGVNR